MRTTPRRCFSAFSAFPRCSVAASQLPEATPCPSANSCYRAAVLNLNPLRDRLAGPFVPFVIYLSDGRKFAVPHRDFIAVGRGVVSIVDERDSTHTVDALHIVSISDVPPRRAKAGK